MMNYLVTVAQCVRLFCLCVSLTAIAPAFFGTSAKASPAVSKGEKTIGKLQEQDAQKVVRTLVQAMRFGKDSLALKQLDLQAMGMRLLPTTWGQMSATEKQSFLGDFETVLMGDSLPRGRELFRFLDTLVFKDLTVQGDDATLPNTIVVHRNLKKTEMVVTWTLHRGVNGWKIVDLTSMGESTLAGIAEEQVKPLLQEGGTAAVLKALHERAKDAGHAHREAK